jgi:hypothetical protein
VLPQPPRPLPAEARVRSLDALRPAESAAGPRARSLSPGRQRARNGNGRVEGAEGSGQPGGEQRRSRGEGRAAEPGPNRLSRKQGQRGGTSDDLSASAPARLTYEVQEGVSFDVFKGCCMSVSRCFHHKTAATLCPRRLSPRDLSIAQAPSLV